MLVKCELEVKTRLSQSQVANSKPSRGAIAIYKDKTRAANFVIYNNKHKTGFKYRLKNNVQKVFSKFIDSGKMTISFKEPHHDVAVSKAISSDLKKLVHAMRLCCKGEETSDVDFNKPDSIKGLLDDTKTELKITSKEDYTSKKELPPALSKLIMGDCGLIKFDTKFLKLKNLSVLDLRNNWLNELPEAFGGLVNLKELYLAGNSFTSIPNMLFTSEIRLNLKLLDVSSNNIKKIPTEIGLLKHLVNLKIDNNMICMIPGTIGMLTSLRYLNISKNYLRVLPYEVSSLTLHSLDISGNQLKADLSKTIAMARLADVPTLLEVAARMIINSRINYAKEPLPVTLVKYLDFAKYCICGKSCFQSYAQCMTMLDLGKIAHTVTADTFDRDRMGAPAIGQLCSRLCVAQWQRLPHGAEWR